MGAISEIMGAIVGSDVDLGDLYRNIGKTGQAASTAAAELATQLPGMTAFRPFTVTSGTSQVSATPEGGFAIGLSPAAQAQQDVLRQQANYYLTQPAQGVNQLGLASQQAFNLANDPNRLAMTSPGAYAGFTGLQNQAGNLASQFLGSPAVGTDVSQLGGLQAMYQGMQGLGQVPAGTYATRGAAQQAFGLGGDFARAARTQPADINALRGQFAGQVGGLLGQQPSPAISQFGQQALGMGQAGLGGSGVPDISQTFAGLQAPGLRDVSRAYAGVQDPGVRTAAGQLAARGLGLGMAGLDTQAPADVEALRRQYGGLAGQAAGDVLTPTAAREADVYERIRATQRPEEQRQQLALEERLAQQGRLGVRTAMYGGTPEQLALAQAQEEAQNRASLAAIQQAQSERQQALGTAQALGGMFTGQAGLSSQLQSQAQQRAAQLSQLGLGAEQVQAQLESEGFGRQMQLGQAGMQAQQAQAQLEAQRLGQQVQLGQAGIGAAQAQSALQSQAQQRAAQLSQLGLSAQQIESQLQSEGLGRATTSAQQAAQLAQLAGGLQAQQAGLGAQFLGLGGTMAQQEQALRSVQQQRALQAMGAGQGLLTGGLGMQQAQLGLGATSAGLMGQLASQRQGFMSQNLQDILAAQQMGAGLAGSSLGLQQAQQQLGLGAMGASYLPEQQALGMLSAATPYASIADVARRQGAQLYGETAMSGLDAMMAGQLGQANLIGGIVPGVVQGLGNIASTTIEGILNKI